MNPMYFYLPFLVQTLVISFDEFYFHIRRGLPRWERIGHPLDTLSVALCLGYVLFFPYSKSHLIIYACFALFSCIFVTKDEFVHKEHSPAPEQWLHAFLFLNHPLVLIVTALLWIREERLFLLLQLCLSLLFALYQIIYWNILWKKT